MDFPEWLEARLQELDLRKVELARQLGLSPAAVSQWVSGATGPAERHIPRLARALGVSPYEIYLRLGRVQPRPEIDAAWELFIHKVERAGAEFKAMILNAIDDMLRAWLVRPRGVRTYLQISLGRLFEAPMGVRGPSSSSEKLVYYGPVELGDGGTTDLLLSASEVDAGSRRCRITGQVGCEGIERAYLLCAGALCQAVIEDKRFVFEPVPLRDGEEDLLLILEGGGQPRQNPGDITPPLG